jgi:hypothetical protein
MWNDVIAPKSPAGAVFRPVRAGARIETLGFSASTDPAAEFPAIPVRRRDVCFILGQMMALGGVSAAR